MIPILSRLNLNRSRLILIPMILTQNRLIQIPMNLTLMNLIQTPRTQLRHSQYVPNKQIDKRKKGSEAPKEIVNGSASSIPLLNRPPLTPIVCGGKSACVPFDLSRRTQHLSARMRRSFCRFGLTRRSGCGSLAPVSVLRSGWTAPFTGL